MSAERRVKIRRNATPTQDANREIRMFLKLTEMGSGTPQFINMQRVERMVATANGGSLLFYAAEQCEAHVKESPDQIVELIAEQSANPAAYWRTFTEAVNGIRDNVAAACRALATGAQATGPQATGAQATGAQATGARATGR